MSDVPAMQLAGERRKLGLLAHPCGRQSLCAVFEDHVEPFSESQLIAIAKSGAARGRDKFGPEFIANQSSYGSCNGWAGARALTRARVRRGLPLVMLSGSYLYSLINGGRDNGSMLEDGMQALQQRGVATDATVPVSAIYPTKYDRKKADAEASKNRAFECYAVGSRLGLFTAAAKQFDLVVAVDVNGSFDRLDSDGFPGSGNGGGNHAVGADGLTWAGGELALDGFNSWGVGYGSEGRMLLSWKRHFTRTFENHVFYAIRSTLDGVSS